jgi:hypothetical protein
MFFGPPLPLSPDLPLNFLLHNVRPSETLGAWVRHSTLRLSLHDTMRAGGRILVSADLGFLLGRCNRVALRERSAPVILDADMVIQWRTLQVITGLPYLPGLGRLVEQFPGIIPCGPLGLLIPIPERSPEEVLAECLATGMQVTGSRVVYYSQPDAAGQPTPTANRQ